MAEQIRAAVSLLRRKQVEQRVGLSRSAIYERMADGTFPRPCSLGGRAVAWSSDQIDAWIAARIAEAKGAR